MLTAKHVVSQEQLTNFCQRWHITELALFGSALREDFREESDVDVMVAFAPDARWSLFDLVEMQRELQDIFGRDVDLITRRGLESSRNYLRRQAILSSAEVIYAS
jgi:predicted nucleotidyltransferase